MVVIRHSPLTGIFLIRRVLTVVPTSTRTPSQSPDGDFFDPELTGLTSRQARD